MRKHNENITEIGRLIMLARGSRSLRQYAEDAGVNFTTVSKVENGEYKPSPKMIQKLTSPEAKPQNGVTYEDVMNAAGFKTSNDEDVVTEVAHEIAEQIADEKLNEGSIIEGASKNETSEREADKKLRTAQLDYQVFRQRRLLLINIATGIIFNSISERRMVFTTVQDDDRPWRFNEELSLTVDKGRIKKWIFDFKGICVDYRHYHMDERIVYMRLFKHFVEDNMKLSIVTNYPDFFNHIAIRAHKVPYRGELSVILVNLEKMKVEKEIYLSNYYENDYSSEFFLA